MLEMPLVILATVSPRLLYRVGLSSVALQAYDQRNLTRYGLSCVYRLNQLQINRLTEA